ncbi:hypothetical protein [Roseimaritima ulvae]|uniref:Uncharacterized protein n=1 Tax=Roseimaritima ulvae TaxID=980254 RepID=A0A5B9QQG6_9BACT|nr:hypothetical protein [Roseimaritima ulvae]QEG39755.1 hypothetical protein UC8_17530 [Roseimaritima ulvae]
MNPGLFVLLRFIYQQYVARLQRTAQRLRSPRRLIPTVLVLIPALLWLPYLLAAAWLRPPADLDHLHRWLSGGLTLYAIFHIVRASWQTAEIDLGMTAAQRQWLACSPLPRWMLVVNKMLVVLVPTFIKASMLCLLLACDTPHPALAAIAIISALLTLELVRLFLFTLASGLSGRWRAWMRIAGTTMAVAIVAQVLVRVLMAWQGPWDHTAPVRFVMSVFAALGETAADVSIQRVGFVFQPFATLAVCERIDETCLASAAAIPALVGMLIAATLWADRFSQTQRLRHEQRRLRQYRAGQRPLQQGGAEPTLQPARRAHGERLRALPFWGGIGPLMARQLVTLRRYRLMVFVSLAIPGLLSLLPLMLGGMGTGTVLDVIGGLAFYTLLLAPPALKMDFRRDIEIMLPLAAMPMRPLLMMIGQIAVPVLITIVFQCTVVAIALVFRPVSIMQAAFWLGTLAGTAVFAFALENALFLAFPHRLKQEGIEMFVRAKLAFIGKGCLWALATVVLLAWALLCARTFEHPLRMPVLAMGILVLVWSAAAGALWIAARTWKRFDLSSDLPA